MELAQQPARKRRTNYRKDGYHHGNLDAALLEIGTRLIDQEGVGAVTLRRVSEKAGVTATAAQHHFGGCGATPWQRKRGSGRVQQACIRLDSTRYAAQNGDIAP